jgi:hypothetical protein
MVNSSFFMVLVVAQMYGIARDLFVMQVAKRAMAKGERNGRWLHLV